VCGAFRLPTLLSFGKYEYRIQVRKELLLYRSYTYCTMVECLRCTTMQQYTVCDDMACYKAQSHILMTFVSSLRAQSKISLMKSDQTKKCRSPCDPLFISSSLVLLARDSNVAFESTYESISAPLSQDDSRQHPLRPLCQRYTCGSIRNTRKRRLAP
jgi:hypothetical protein